MSNIAFSPFGGLVPKTDPLMLPPGGAQTATNCRFTAGVLEAYKLPSLAVAGTIAGAKTIYRFGQSTVSDTTYWFQKFGDVNFVKGPVAADTTERTFFTDGVRPQVTYAALAIGTPPYPSQSTRLGLPPPPVAPSILVGVTYPTHAETAVAETVYYVYTYVDALGQESPPSPVSSVATVYPAGENITPAVAARAAVTGVTGVAASAAVPARAAVMGVDSYGNSIVLSPATPYIPAVAFVQGVTAVEAVAAVPSYSTPFPRQDVVVGFSAAPAGDFTISTIRVYRTSTGSSGTDYLLVDEIPAAYSSYTDTKENSELGEPCPTMLSSNIPAGALGLLSLPNGIMAAFLGYDVYFSDVYKPYSWPEGYIQTMDYPVVGIGAFGTTVVVLTNGFPYLITGSDPQSMSAEKLTYPYACLSKRSIVSAFGGVLYAAADGLVQISPSGVTVMTESLMTRREWSDYNPASMMFVVWDEKVFIFYEKLGGSKGGLILDVAFGLSAIADHATAAYTDPVTGSLFLVLSNNSAFPNRADILKWDAGAASTFTWKSGKRSTPIPHNFAFGQVLADTYPITVTITATKSVNSAYVDNTITKTYTVTDDKPFRLYSGFKARVWEMTITGSGKVFAAYIADSTQELQSV